MMNELKQGAIPVVLAFTPNYFVPAATCLSSILRHSAEESSFHVLCLLTEDLGDAMKRSLEALGGGRMVFSYINLAGRLADIYVDARYTVAASYRLLLPDLLPQYDKVLYVDCDVVVRNDLAALYHRTDLTGYYLGAVFEAPLESQLDYLKKLGIQPGRYINSGFLLMNLQKLRVDGMVDKLLAAARRPDLQFPDQDVLNQLCGGHILGLPPYYNGIRTFYLPQYRDIFLRYYTEEDWSAVQDHGTVHYTGGKPWDTFTVAFGVWWDYYEDLPGDIRSQWRLNKRLYCLSKIYKTSMGKYMLEGIQRLVRQFKYGVS